VGFQMQGNGTTAPTAVQRWMVMGMDKCKECVHYLVCQHYQSKPYFCNMFMQYENTVEVVRCKDCKWYRPPFCLLNDNKHGWLNHELPDHFCSHGERKTDG
jgi:hypothetical protein